MCLKTPPARPTRKPAAKPARSMKWLTHCGHALGTLQITQGSDREVYAVSPLITDDGSLAVRLEKCSDADAVYDVVVGEQVTSCTCPAGTYRPQAQCRHVAAVLALAARSAL